MKTNMMMEVNIGKYGNVMIGHLTQMGKLNEILDIGNSIREQKGLKAKSLHTYLRSKNTWELILKVYNEENKKELREFTKKSDNEKEFCQLAKKSNDDENTFSPIGEKLLYQETLDNLPQDEYGKIKYTEIAKTKIFDKVFKIQNRGKLVNRGTWANLFVMLDLAQWLDVDLRYEIYRVFIEEKLLRVRDDGGEEFKNLSYQLYSKLGIYKIDEDHKVISRTVRDRVFGKGTILEFKKLEPKGNIWNSDYATIEHLQARDKLLGQLTDYLQKGFIKTYTQLLNII